MSMHFRFSATGPRLLGAAFVGLLIAAGNAAGAASDVRSVAVRYGDLDLGREAGVQALYGRLRAAAASACGRQELRDLRQRQQWRECRDAALARAVSELGNARLATLHREKQARES